MDNTYSGPVISITVDNTTIEATVYHPFWVIEGRDLQERSKPRDLQEHEDEGHSLPGRWGNSHELRAGDCIITRSGTRAIITEIRQRFDDAFPVSNLSIIGHHNYAVGDVEVLVHNDSICNDAIAALRKDREAGRSIEDIQALLNQLVKDGKHTQKEVDDALAKILDPNWKPEGTDYSMKAVRERWWGGKAPVRPNPDMPRGREYMELSHTYISNNGAVGKHIPDWIKNRGWNLKPMWGSDHALVDPHRYKFMKKTWKNANKIYSPMMRMLGRMPTSHKVGAGVVIVGGAGYGVYEYLDGDQ